MKKLLIITGCIAVLAILINAHTQAHPLAEEAPSIILPSITTLPAEETSEASPYLLKEFDKRVAVFARDENEPLFVSEVYVSELPKADRRLLKSGIPVGSKKELTRLLEDYCS